jgi:hypothetical protein
LTAVEEASHFVTAFEFIEGENGIYFMYMLPALQDVKDRIPRNFANI